MQEWMGSLSIIGEAEYAIARLGSEEVCGRVSSAICPYEAWTRVSFAIRGYEMTGKKTGYQVMFLGTAKALWEWLNTEFRSRHE